MKKSRAVAYGTYFLLTLGLVFILIPLYYSLISALKTNAQLTRDFFGFPERFNLDNFAAILGRRDYYSSLLNSFFITAVSILLCVLFLPMAAYPIARKMHSSRVYKFLYIFMVAGIFVPFMVRMMPVIKLLNAWGLANKWGLMLIYLGGSTCEGIFLITGFMQTVPPDLEEAAYIDGASTAMVFFRVVYPVIRPIVATVAIKCGLWFWNDFLLPSLILKLPADRTLVLFQFSFKGEYATEYPLLFACFLLSMLPIMIFYFVMQKNIMSGLMAGAIKG